MSLRISVDNQGVISDTLCPTPCTALVKSVAQTEGTIAYGTEQWPAISIIAYMRGVFGAGAGIMQQGEVQGISNSQPVFSLSLSVH